MLLKAFLIFDSSLTDLKFIQLYLLTVVLKQVVDFGQPNYLKVMESCLSEGKPILIQNVGEVLDPSIAPILDKAIVKIGAALVIKFNEKMVPYDPNFKLYLTTKLGMFVYYLSMFGNKNRTFRLA